MLADTLYYAEQDQAYFEAQAVSEAQDAVSDAYTDACLSVVVDNLVSDDSLTEENVQTVGVFEFSIIRRTFHGPDVVDTFEGTLSQFATHMEAYEG